MQQEVARTIGGGAPLKDDIEWKKCVLALGCDFVSSYTDKQIRKRGFFFCAKLFHLCNRLLCICLVQKQVLLVNTQILITK